MNSNKLEKEFDISISKSGEILSPRTTDLPRKFAAAIGLLLIGILVFRDFLFGGKLLLYKDVGSDSVNHYFPYFVHISDYLRQTGLPSWSFSIGMGQDLSYLIGYLVLDPVVWLPRSIIPHGLVIQHLVKILIVGLLFMRFLQLRSLNFRSALAGSLFLCFSGYMSIGSCWPVFADEVLCLSFVLFAAEKAIRGGPWIYLSFATALVGLTTVFHLYLCGMLLCLYVPARLVELYGWNPIKLSRICVRLAAVALLGLGLSAVIWLGNAQSVLNSPRGSGMIANTPNWAVPTLFQLETFGHYITAALRFFSTDILGTGSDFRGSGNYLEAPLAYCGLFSLLIFPQVFVGATFRQRILYGGFVCFILLPIMFPWLRYLFWLFQGGYYRAFSLFSIFGIITLSMMALCRYVGSQKLNLWVLATTLLALLGVLYPPMGKMEALDPTIRQMAAILLLSYAALLATGQLAKRQSIVAGIIVGVSAIELVHFNWITVSNHPTVMKDELKQRVGYNDATLDAVRDVKSNDDTFFRIRKTWPSGPSIHTSLNDAMVFGYFGTPSFSDFNNLNYIRFLMAVDAISPAAAALETIWSPGLAAHPLLSTFACEKYVLTKNPEPFNDEHYYEFVRRYGDIYLFRNQLFLPFGLIFTKFIPEDAFLLLPGWAKEVALLHTAVVSSKDAADPRGLSELPLEELKRQLIETSLPDIIAERRSAAFNLRSFRQTRIAGTIQPDRKSILVFQTPFDAGWHALIDGRAAPTFRVDAGLLGIMVEKGEHAVELRYRPTLLYAGGAVTLLSCCILCFGLWKWPRRDTN